MTNKDSAIQTAHNPAWQKVNIAYAVFLVAMGGLWIAQLHTFGVIAGVIAIVVSYFLYQNQRWAYFTAAVLCFGLLRTAMDDGYDFHQGFQSVSKLIYVVAIVFALILHEKVAIKKTKKNNEDELNH
jgi:amino acid permease